MDDDVQPALGAVVEQERGSLPYALIHGEALVACAAWALGDAGVTAVDLGTEWAGLVDSEETFVLHDPLCPMTPASFIAACVRESLDHDAVVVGADAEGRVLAPVVLPPVVVASLDALPSLDFAELVTRLRERFPVRLLEAPPGAARVHSLADVAALETSTRPEPA